MYQNEKRSAKLAYWKEMVTRQKESGLSSKEFCIREHLSPASFHWWKRKIAESEKPIDTSGFVEIEPKENERADLKPVKIIITGLCILEVQEEISPEYIARLVQALWEVR